MAVLSAVAALVTVAGVSGASAATVQPTPSPVITSTAQIAQLRTQLRDGTIGKTHGVNAVCSTKHLHCQAQALTTTTDSQRLLVTGTPIGYGPPDLQKAYGATGNGTGTIAILDAGAYPNLESDLRIYRDTYGLSRCTIDNGCLKVMSYKGGKPVAPALSPEGQFVEEEDAIETALDVDMASAACPRCKIVVGLLPWKDGDPYTQADEDVATEHFAVGAQTAIKLGAKAVSISYGYDPDAYDLHGAPAKGLTNPGTAVFASSGDYGFSGDYSIWPQALSTVASVGGTSLYTSATKRGFTDVAWAGAGSSCTDGVGPANGQPKAVAAACGGERASADISAVADPNTGVAVYDSYSPAFGYPLGFIVVGGTSASSPFVAGLAARAGVPAGTLGPNEIYKAPASTLVDVTIGQNAPAHLCDEYGYDTTLCTSGPGWDGPTGRGVPHGTGAFKG